MAEATVNEPAVPQHARHAVDCVSDYFYAAKRESIKDITPDGGNEQLTYLALSLGAMIGDRLTDLHQGLLDVEGALKQDR